MVKFERTYAPEEFFYRFGVFKANMDFVDAHNKGNNTYEVELNKFADLTTGEFKNIYLGYKPELARGNKRVARLSTSFLCPLPILPALLTGPNSVLSLVSKIKANAAHAGLSLPLVVWRVLSKLTSVT